ncbi:Transgelin-3 [Terramyces sp. JEL0728]|nr:Transgelin-3 [Terramyces sp. JEL0728]
MNPLELYKNDLKSSIVRENEAREWIENVVGIAIEEDLATALNDGIILCKLSNALTPHSTPIKYASSSLPFKKMDNISKFLDTLPSLGLSSFETFQTVDLFEKKNINQVIDCIFAISRNAEKNGYQGPLLGNRQLRSRNSMNSTISNSSRNSDHYVNSKLSQSINAVDNPAEINSNYKATSPAVMLESKDSDLDSSNTTVENLDFVYSNQGAILQNQDVDQPLHSGSPVEQSIDELDRKVESIQNPAVQEIEESVDQNIHEISNVDSDSVLMVKVAGPETEIVVRQDNPEEFESDLPIEKMELTSPSSKSPGLKVQITPPTSNITTIITDYYADQPEHADIIHPIPIKSPPSLQINYSVEEQFEDSPDSLNYVEMFDESKYYQTEDLNCFSPSKTIMETIIEESECSTLPTTSEDQYSYEEVSSENDLKSDQVAKDIDNEIAVVAGNPSAEAKQDTATIELENLSTLKVTESTGSQIPKEILPPEPNILEDQKQPISTLKEYPSKEEIREKVLKRQSSAFSIYKTPNGNVVIPDCPNDMSTFNPELVFLKLANMGYKQTFNCSNIHTKDTSVENIINVTNAKLQNLGYRF